MVHDYKGERRVVVTSQCLPIIIYGRVLNLLALHRLIILSLLNIHRREKLVLLMIRRGLRLL